jgi:uncharacterized phage protein (TIGR02216 family)
VRRVAWRSLMRLGLVELGLAPEVFWSLTPAELMFLAGLDASDGAMLTRAGLDGLMARFPDEAGRGRRPMADHDDDIARLEAQFLGLESSLVGLEGVTVAFRRELDGAGGSLRDTGREAAGMSRSVSGSIRTAFEGIVFDGKRAGDALRGLGQSLSNAVLNQALAPVQGAIGKAVGGGIQAMVGGMLPFAAGGVLSSGRVQAFARGGVVDRPVAFPMRGGAGLMGEAGPEAILPLARGSDGRLGVRAGAGGGTVQVTMNITTPDAESFQRSKSQVAAELTRALERGRRNL